MLAPYQERGGQRWYAGTADAVYQNWGYVEDQGADAVLILTDWKEFAAIDLTRLNRVVKFPIVIDGRNLYKPHEMQAHGFTYVSVGRPANYQAQEGKPRKLIV